MMPNIRLLEGYDRTTANPYRRSPATFAAKDEHRKTYNKYNRIGEDCQIIDSTISRHKSSIFETSMEAGGSCLRRCYNVGFSGIISTKNHYNIEHINLAAVES